MKSFDFYDTLFVRLVAEPRGIFQLVEHMLDLPGFSMRRRLAERAVSARLGAREITLADIYAEPDLEADRWQGAMELEQRLEAELLSPIAENLERVTGRDMVVSDMYLPEAFFQAVFADALPLDRRPTPIVSSMVGKRKSDGRLWQHIVQSGTKPALHIGDNLVSDVKRPRRFGIPSEHYRTAHLNRFEKHLLGGGLNGSVMAGVARGTRLSAQLSKEERCIWGPLVDAFASVFAPVVVGFVEYIIADAMNRGIEDIFFLARDGQIPFRVAEKIIERRSLPLRSHYLYASRQSLHMAGYSSPQAAASWLLEDTPELSVATIASRSNLSLDIFLEPAREVNIHDVERPLPRHQRSRLIELLEKEDVANALQQEADRQWKVANAYFRGAGLRPGSSVAIVDVGWNGRIQRSLRSILDRDGLPETRMIGYYLCMSSKVQTTAADELIGFLHDPDLSRGRCPFDAYRPVIEASLFADHGSTRGFKWDEQAVVADLEPPPSSNLREAILRQQDTILRFTDLLLRVEAVTGYHVQWDVDALRSILVKFLNAPSVSEARAFTCHEIDIEQLEKISKPLVVPHLTWRSFARRQSLGHWPEGSLALSGRQGGLMLFRVARLLYDFLRRRTAPILSRT
ncbi:MAG: hypothetical protein WAT93_14950 [Pontixanthobacter sp.]